MRWSRWLGCAILAWLLTVHGALAAPTVLRYGPQGPIYDYRWALLSLALEHTRASDGPCRLVPADGHDFSQARTMALLQRGELDVTTFGYSPEREARMRPVRVDLLRGMLGFRVLLIRTDQQARFRHLDAQAFRRAIVLGFNSQWADLAILQANGYQVVTSPSYDNLFSMLVAGRFDAFPRGLNEAGRELQMFGPEHPELGEEKTLALFMHYPVYFWVRKDAVALAQRIERGLNLALEDGSFKALFLRYHGKDIAREAKNHRRIFFLKNPYLPQWFTPSDTSWWWPDPA